MQHIINVAFDFDDNAVKERIEKNVENEVINKIYSDIEGTIFRKNWYSGKIDHNDLEPTKEIVKSMCFDLVQDNKDLIIDCVIEQLVDHIKRTKKFKEAYGEAIEENK